MPPMPDLMPDPILYAGPDLDTLYPRLLELLDQPHPARQAGRLNMPERIVIQARGIDQWLTGRLAQDRGIAANICYQLPRRFVEEAVVAHLNDAGRTGAEPKLSWMIADELARSQATLPTLIQKYLATGDCPGDRILSLAAILHETFDDRLNFDPEGDRSVMDPALASLMSRVLAADTDPAWQHPGNVVRELGSQGAIVTDWGRVILFGVSFLPEYHQRIIDALARGGTQVYLFMLTPSHYWLSDQHRRKVLTEDRFSNPLVAYLGDLAKRQQALLERWSKPVEELSAAQRPDTVLGRVQARMDALEGGVPDERCVADTSLEFHACFGPLRQVEAVRGRILQALMDDPSLRPEDFLVMTPNLDSYAPFVRAVFAERERDSTGRVTVPALPVTIAEQVSYDDDPWAATTGDLLELLAGRYSWSAGAALLERTPVLTRLELDRAEATALQQLLQDLGVRWGADAGQQKRWLHGEADGSFGWQQAWRRLALSAAGGGQSATLWNGFEGETTLDTELLAVAGKAAPFFGRLADEVAVAAEPRSCADWCRWLRALFLDLFHTGPQEETPSGTGPVLGTLGELEEESRDSVLKISLDRFRMLLAERMEEGAVGARFLRGGVTVSRFAPIRSVPAPVVILLGMEEGAFPRRNLDSSLGLLCWKPEVCKMYLEPPGRRERDQQLFLESVLAARRCLWIFYQGKTSETQKKVSPCGPVALLHEEATRCLTDSEKGYPVVEHPLHPFGNAYFRTSDPRGLPPVYHTLWAEAANQRPQIGQPGYRFVTAQTELPEVHTTASDEERSTLYLSELRRALRTPWHWWLERVVHIQASRGTQDGGDEEPDQIDALARWQMVNDILFAESQERRALLMTPQYWRARQKLPPGMAGQEQWEALIAENLDLFAQMDGLQRAQSYPVDVQLVQPMAGGADGSPLSASSLCLTGTLDLLADMAGNLCAVSQRRKGKEKGKDLLSWWLDHLLLCATGKSGLRVIGPDASWRFVPLSDRDARMKLKEFVLFLSKWRQCIPSLLPEAGYGYARQKKKLQEGARSKKSPVSVLIEAITPGFYASYIPDFPDEIRWITSGKTGEELLDHLGREQLIQTAEAFFDPLLEAWQEEA